MTNKKSIVTMAAMLFAAVVFCSCAKEVTDEYEPESAGENALHVFTRGTGGTDAAYVTYPVQVYAFNATGDCVAVQTIADDEDALSLTLANGEYNIYAIGGAQADRYEWPSQENATPTTRLVLAEGKTLDDLQAASGSVTLNNEDANLLLTLERKVMMLDEVIVEQVPASVTAVSVTLQPLYESLLLDGSYDGTAGESVLSLTCQADGTTWRYGQAALYLFPSVGTLSITIRFTSGDTTTSYTYQSEGAMTANHHFSLTGTYAGSGFHVSGTLTGQDWGVDQAIAFTFNETHKTGEENNNGGG